MQYMFLPPYSPDYNPIELAFSSIKAFVWHAGELRRDDLDPNVDDTYVYIHLLSAAFPSILMMQQTIITIVAIYNVVTD